MPTPPKPPELAPEAHRALGAGLYNRCWDLMEVEDRTTDQDDELLATAYASAWHWRQVGHVANQARAPLDVQPGRRGPRAAARLAVHHARRCVEIVEGGGEGIEDWDAPAAYEAMARALGSGRRPGHRGRVEGPCRRRPGHDPRCRRTARPIEGDLATIPDGSARAVASWRPAGGPMTAAQPTQRAATVEFDHVTKTYDARAKAGARGAVNDLTLSRPRRQDLRARRPVGLRQDDLAQDGQPADRADVRAGSCSTASTSRRGTSPSSAAASGT